MLFVIKIEIFILGMLIGSFLNVVILRWGHSTFLKGRSRCPGCGKTLRWYEMIPVLSFLFLGGKCSSCGEKLTIQYPLVEFFTGLIFLALFLKTGFCVELFYHLIIFSLLILIFVYDLKYKIIPDAFVWSFVGLTFISLFIQLSPSLTFVIPELLRIASGVLFSLPLFSLWFFSGGEWMGLGDAKLALGIGWLLGFWPGLSAVILSFWIGAIVGLLLIGVGKLSDKIKVLNKGLFLKIKKLTMKSEIPFGPFLIIGSIIVFFYGVDVIGLISKLLCV